VSIITRFARTVLIFEDKVTAVRLLLLDHIRFGIESTLRSGRRFKRRMRFSAKKWYAGAAGVFCWSVNDFGRLTDIPSVRSGLSQHRPLT